MDWGWSRPQIILVSSHMDATGFAIVLVLSLLCFLRRKRFNKKRTATWWGRAPVLLGPGIMTRGARVISFRLSFSPWIGPFYVRSQKRATGFLALRLPICCFSPRPVNPSTGVKAKFAVDELSRALLSVLVSSVLNSNQCTPADGAAGR